MEQQVLMTIIEFIASLILEGVILGFIFQMISNRSQEKQQKELQREMYRLETQNRYNTDILTAEMKDIRDDIISEIKQTTS